MKPGLATLVLLLAASMGCDDASDSVGADASAVVDGSQSGDGSSDTDAVLGADAAPETDAGSVDAGSVDGGSVDATSVDAGSVDAAIADQGQPDGAPPDSGLVPGNRSTDGVLCDFEGSGQQRLVYAQRRGAMVDETLDYAHAWSCTDDERRLTGNGVPNHAVTGGQFATPLSAQRIAIEVTLDPVDTGEATPTREPGYALNGVKFDPATAGTCPGDAEDESECDYAMGRDAWQMVATPGDTSPWRFAFGVDENDAHVQPNGQYHYHGNPIGLVDNLNPNAAQSMTLVGWAWDGFPIYSVEGHSDPGDASSPMVKMRSSFQTIEPPAGRPSVEDFPMGHFEQDWAYVAGAGDLDQCNGRFAVTPEFPEGIYHYHITETYPFVMRCVKGTSNAPVRPGGP